MAKRWRKRIHLALPRLTFFGGAQTVTGSKILLEYKYKRYLIDCGLFQGIKSLRELNWLPLPFNPNTIDAVLITHGHLDHVGYLPRLVKLGFRGPIHATYPTIEVSEVILKDSAKIQEEDAEEYNRRKASKHKPALPLYTVKDVEATMPLFKGHSYHQWVELEPAIRFRFHNTGHVLGSAAIEVMIDDLILLFSGDVGRRNPLLLYPWDPISKADYIVLESTYGDRLHPQEPPEQTLKQVILDTYKKKGILMVPTFALERAQEILYLIHQLKAKKEIPFSLPVFLDSPMGIDMTTLMSRYTKWHRLGTKARSVLLDGVKMVVTREESKRVIRNPAPKIVLAGSGMVHGGRILHYLERYISDPRHTVLLTGYQAEGTRGRFLKEGAPEIKIFGKWYPVRARIAEITSLSAHADQSELLDYLQSFERKKVKNIFLNHGEPQASDHLRIKIQDEYGFDVTIAEMSKPYVLNPRFHHLYKKRGY